MTEQNTGATVISTAEQDDAPEWIDLSDGHSETVDLRVEGRSDILGGQVVARLELGGTPNSPEEERLPSQEVHLLSIHTPENLDFQNLLKWNNIYELTGSAMAVVSLDEAGRPTGTALLLPGTEYVLGREGNIRWFRYGYSTEEVGHWTPFQENDSISRDHVRLDMATKHVTVEKNPESRAYTRIARG